MQSVQEAAGIPLALGYRPGQSREEREERLREFKAASDRGAAARSGVAAAISQACYTFNAVGIELGYRYERGAVVPGDESYAPSPDPDLIYIPQTAAGCALPHAVITDPAGASSPRSTSSPGVRSPADRARRGSLERGVRRDRAPHRPGHQGDRDRSRLPVR